LEHAQLNDLSIRLVERFEDESCTPQGVAIPFVLDHAFRVIRYDARWRQTGKQRTYSPNTAFMLVNKIVGSGDEPREDVRLVEAPQFIGVFEGHYENSGRNVLGILRMSGSAEAMAINTIDVMQIELRERRLRTDQPTPPPRTG